MGNKLFSAAGIIKTNVTGEILAPAIHFDIPYATDLWVFLLRSAWYPIKISFDKPALSISHDSTQATAELQSGTGGFGLDEGTLKAYVSTFGEDFKKVTLKIKRKVGNASLDQLLGELATGSQPFIWKPIVPNFDTVLVGNSTININQFLNFLKSLGAKAQQGFFTGSYLQEDFFLGDSPTVNYTLELNGDRGFLRSSKDETKIILQPQ